MRRTGFAVLVALALAVGPARGDTTNDAPDFSEVFGVVREHLTGATDAELNQAAVEGFLSALRGKVTIVGRAVTTVSNGPALVASSVLEGNVGYVRLASFDEQTAGQISEIIARWNTTNSLVGLVLDLRFADSEDYASAAAVADLFQAKARPLLDWGTGVVRSREKPDAPGLPVTVLVNRETGGAAEALAAVLRETGVGLILGGTTAGRAMIGQEFPLKDGRKLRVATLPVKIGEGVELTARGVQPDIAVVVAAADERVLMKSPYGPASPGTNVTGLAAASGAGVTNRPARRPRPNEADLVRARRDGVNLDEEFMDSRVVEPGKPLIRDPVLARAVDLIKGLAVVRAAKS